MKPIYLSLGLMFFPFLESICQNNMLQYDFESYDTTPYFYKFGNNKNVDYYPRWQYSHQVTSNPLQSSENNSLNVLQYTSLEARKYGLKIRFQSPLNIEDIETIQFLIYQPENIIGKSVNGAYSSSPASSQEIRVKLLTYFNALKDFREDDGVVLTFSQAIQPFFTTNKWVSYSVMINTSDFSAAELNKLRSGVLGIAILPTYNDGVTLNERYVCCIDDIVVRQKTNSGVKSVLDSRFSVQFVRDEVVLNAHVTGSCHVKIFNSKGMEVSIPFNGFIENTSYKFSVPYPKGVYIVSVYYDGRYHNYKINTM